MVALQDVVQRFPDTEYARDATLKIDATINHLTGRDGDQEIHLNAATIGAINRFKVVFLQYQRTLQITEALEPHQKPIMR
jgi:outer membrane protein assembly factor BamD